MAEKNAMAGLLTKAACHTAVYSNKTLPQTKVIFVHSSFPIISKAVSAIGPPKKADFKRKIK